MTSTPLHTYRINFSAYWLGGVAIVRAADAVEARSIVETHHAEAEEARRVDGIPDSWPVPFEIKHVIKLDENERVLYYANGDY